MKRIVALFLSIVTLLSVFSIASISASAAAKSPWDYSKTPSRAIYYKSPTMKGDDVKWVQQSLNIAVNAKLSIDGSFGPACKTATKKFQKQYGLSQDGSFGPATRNKMVSVLNSKGYYESQPTPTPTPTPSNTSKQLSVNMSYIKGTGYQSVSGPCGCYALAYCRDILDNKTHKWTEYSEGYLSSKGRYSYTAVWSKAGYSSHTGSNKQAVLKALYNSINNNKPAVVRVKGNGSTGHYVCVVGYKNVSNSNSLSESNFLIIDSASKTAFNRGITSMTSGSTGYSIHSNLQYITK